MAVLTRDQIMSGDLGQTLAAMPQAAREALIQQMIAASGGDAGATTNQRTRSRRRTGVPQQRFRLWNAYYSVVRFQALVNVAGPTSTLVFVPQELRPFSYRIGDSLTNAGFDASMGQATEADTNLIKASETNAGEQLEVQGISLMPGDTTDIELFKSLSASMSVVISMDGDARRYRIGRPTMIPGSGGVFGGGPTTALGNNAIGGIPQSQGFSNGWPDIVNYYPFPEPLLWTASGETDSNFNVILKLQRQQLFTETAVIGTPPGPSFLPPTAVGMFGSYVDLMVRLHTEQQGDRSLNS